QPDLYQLVAIDTDATRLSRVKENLIRLQLMSESCPSIELIPCDAGKFAETFAASPDHEQFDAILLDAPCSGSGVIRRHPDIRLLRRAADIPAFAERQKDLLKMLWPLLKPG